MEWNGRSACVWRITASLPICDDIVGIDLVIVKHNEHGRFFDFVTHRVVHLITAARWELGRWTAQCRIAFGVVSNENLSDTASYITTDGVW